MIKNTLSLMYYVPKISTKESTAKNIRLKIACRNKLTYYCPDARITFMKDDTVQIDIDNGDADLEHALIDTMENILEAMPNAVLLHICADALDWTAAQVK